MISKFSYNLNYNQNHKFYKNQNIKQKLRLIYYIKF